MGRTKITYASYRAMPAKNRFWLYSENGYTADELEFRLWVLKTRASSGIHPDYLANPSSWFSEDSQALVDVNERSWIYSPSFKPRHTLTRDDFHIQPIDGQRMNWPGLYDLMQKVGDYLLLRNKDIRSEHLNQPMNYIFLDINLMLKGLIQNPDISQVKDQLELITHYIRTIEKNVSPIIGSDRLFLVNFRSIINDKIMPYINHLIESRQLQERLHNLSKLIKQVSTERNRVLHFALSAQQVNPHSYEFFIEMPKDLSAYPTQAAKTCLQGQMAIPMSESSDHTPSPLKNCPHFKLITTDDELNKHYTRAIIDLNELEHFQIIITQINGLLEQAGEVYTVHQFKTQMLQLFDQTWAFLEESSGPINAIIDANTQAYHKAIQDQQDLSFWKKWFTSEEKQLRAFIKNQDTLAQFPSGLSDLGKTNDAAQTSTKEIMHHLSQPKNIETSFEAISAQAQELDKLMGTMHHWITSRYQHKGLPAPLPPEPIHLLEKPEVTLSHSSRISATPLTFFSATSSQFNCPNQGDCHIPSVETRVNPNATIALGLLFLIPAVVFGLYLLFNRNSTSKKEHSTDLSLSNQKKQFTQLIIQFEDQLTVLRGYEDSSEQDLSNEYEPYFITYSTLKKQAERGIYDIDGLKEAYEGLKYFYEEYTDSSTERDTNLQCVAST